MHSVLRECVFGNEAAACETKDFDVASRINGKLAKFYSPEVIH